MQQKKIQKLFSYFKWVIHRYKQNRQNVFTDGNLSLINIQILRLLIDLLRFLQSM